MQDDTDSLVKSIMQRIQLVRDNMDYGQLPALTREYQDVAGPWTLYDRKNVVIVFD